MVPPPPVRMKNRNFEDSVSAFLAPVNGYRGELVRKGISPKDHTRENLRLVREKEKENIQRRQEELQEKEAKESRIQRLARPYGGVTSRVREQLASKSETSSPEKTSTASELDLPSTPSFLRARTLDHKLSERASARQRVRVERDKEMKDGETLVEGDSLIGSRRAVKAPVPKVDELAAFQKSIDDVRSEREPVNFVRENREKIFDSISSSPVSSEPIAATTAPTHKPGEVPKYLLHRKKELQEAEDARKRAETEEVLPPGMRVLPENERLETLSVLERRREETMGELNRLPLTRDTLAFRKRKAGLEEKLAEIEDGIRIFSLPRVLVVDE